LPSTWPPSGSRSPALQRVGCGPLGAGGSSDGLRGGSAGQEAR
jgi:hypothetical protein